MRRPAHADVVASFREHRADYEALRRMVTEDRLNNGLVGSSSFLTPSDAPENLALPPPRAAEYRNRMTAAGIQYISVSPNGTVEFNVANRRAGSYGWYVSVVSASEPPLPRIATIDATESVPSPKGYADLGEGWYAGITWR